VNCQETSHLLDATAPEALTLTQREAIDRHLASCPACRADWTNWGELVALPVPPTPATLRACIAAALPAQLAVPARRAFRPYVVGGVLLATAALAAALVWQSTRRDVRSATAVSSESTAVARVAREIAEAATPAPAVAGDATPAVAPTAVATDDAKPAVNPPMDPHRVVVLWRPEAAAGAPDIALGNRCYQAAVAELRTLDGIKVATDAAVHTRSSFTERVTLAWRDRKIARSLGAAKVLVMSTTDGCSATLFDTRTGEMDQGVGGSGVSMEAGHAERFGQSKAHSVREKTLFDDKGLAAAARVTVLDASRADRERAAALQKLMGNGPPGQRSSFDKEVVAAAAGIARRSEDAQVRNAIWGLLRDVDDASLVQPLLQALVHDADPKVRYQVALDLHTFLDQPGVREALLRAAAEDADREPEWPGTWSVREAAQRAAVAGRDTADWARGLLFDESLPARSRLLNVRGVSPDGRWVGQLNKEAARVVLDIGRREQDAKVRAMAWDALRLAPTDEAFVPVLLADLASHPDEAVRAYAVQVLEQQIGNPQVRAAFERAREDPSIEVRRWVDIALTESASGRGPQP